MTPAIFAGDFLEVGTDQAHQLGTRMRLKNSRMCKCIESWRRIPPNKTSLGLLISPNPAISFSLPDVFLGRSISRVCLISTVSAFGGFESELRYHI